MATRKRKSKIFPGARTYTARGVYVEGRHFNANEFERACSFAGVLVQEYGRGVAVEACLIPGHAERWYLYVPEDSADAAVARRDHHGYVITC